MDNQKLGSFIAEARKRKGMTQLELGDQLHVTDKAVSKWERGIGLPDLKMIPPLAQALDVSILELMTGERSTESGSPDVQAYEAALRTYDATATALKIEKLRECLERWCIFGLINAICFIFVSCFAFFGGTPDEANLFIVGYVLLFLPVLSQILAALLAVFTVIRICRRKKFTMLLLFTLLCLFWPVLQPLLIILFGSVFSAIFPS